MRKNLGQHFLHSPRALRIIAEAGALTAHDRVLEIGPGQGALTELLLQRAGGVVAVEKDPALTLHLHERFTEEIERGALTLVPEDIRSFVPEVHALMKGHFVVVANIPYYITGHLLQSICADWQPSRAVLLVQKEVAERIVGRRAVGVHTKHKSARGKGEKGKESILSISVKAYGTPRIVERVPRGAFSPVPSVDSAIVVIEDISSAFFKEHRFSEAEFFVHVRKAFQGKRKRLTTTLKDSAPTLLHTLALVGLPPTTRPEDLTLDDWALIVGGKKEGEKEEGKGYREGGGTLQD
jgi:16S rRNA (adenine1518-N6/adenine1519-N6)-dimethyltransferase